MPSTYSDFSDDFGELTVDTAMIDVTSNLPRPDKSWRYTDQQGHEHYWRDGWPTLTRVVDETYWCGECNDEHHDTHLECRVCHETIEPGTTGPSGFREFIPGRTTYLLNGEPISKERAEEIMAQRRSRRRG